MILTKQIKQILSKHVPSRAKPLISKLLLFLRKFKNKYQKINYSKEWYEKEYHLNVYHLDKFSYDKLMNVWEKKGYKKRLFEVLDTVDIPNNAKWLETACHHGKTVFWSAERYLDTQFYMFDFSNTAINWINKNNPIPDRTIVWVGDIQMIVYENNSFNNFFDIITCLDVTEHLPFKIYKKGINEIYRVLKPGGSLIIAQGTSEIPEHLNIRTEKQYITDIKKIGFKFVKNLPHNHYSFTK